MLIKSRPLKSFQIIWKLIIIFVIKNQLEKKSFLKRFFAIWDEEEAILIFRLILSQSLSMIIIFDRK